MMAHSGLLLSNPPSSLTLRGLETSPCRRSAVIYLGRKQARQTGRSLQFLQATCQSSITDSNDAKLMRRAVDLAKSALGHTSPNPMVGCVIVKDDQIIGEGYHPKAGEPHAEVFALRQAKGAAAGATAYVSLEPCNHFGRTPPCSQALVKARVKKVVVGMVDPNPLVAGTGVETLRAAGIEVVVGVEEDLCRATNEAFVHRILTQKPFCTLRYAVSLDGKMMGRLAPPIEPQRGSYESKLLAQNDLVVILEDALESDPLLLSAEEGCRQPLRALITETLDLPLKAKVFDTQLAPTVVITTEQALQEDVESNLKDGLSMETRLRTMGVEVIVFQDLDMDQIMDLFVQRGVNSVLLESQWHGNKKSSNHLGAWAFHEDVVQKVVSVIHPVLLGEKGHSFSLSGKMFQLERVSSETSRGTIIVEGYLPKL